MPKITNDTAYPNVTVPALTDEMLVLQSDVLKKESVTQIGTLMGGVSVTYNNTDVTINLAVTSPVMVLLVDNANAVQVNLPSVGAAQIGRIVEIHRLGAGSVTIDAADADVINDSSAGGKIACTVVGQTYAAIRLMLCRETVWRMTGLPVGTWTTS